MIRFDGITIDRENRLIRNGDRWCTLPRKQFVFACALLLAGPKSLDQLFQFIYGDDPGGGPLYAREIMSVWIHGLRRRLPNIGIEVHTYPKHSARGNPKVYWAEPVRLAQVEAAE